MYDERLHILRQANWSSSQLFSATQVLPEATLKEIGGMKDPNEAGEVCHEAMQKTKAIVDEGEDE